MKIGAITWAGALLLLMAIHPGTVRADRALLIGIDAYQTHKDILPLHGAVNDSRNIEKLLLEELGYQASEIKTLRDEQATRAAILEQVEDWLVKGTRRGDRVFFYYAGHGSQLRSEGPDAEDGYDQTLVPVDTDVTPDKRIVGMIRDKELKALFARLQGRRATAVFDACHSGTVTRSIGLGRDFSRARTPLALMHLSQAAPPTRKSNSRDLGETLDRRGKPTLLERRDGLTVWSAVTSYQLALEDVSEDPPQGIFTKSFIAGIRGQKADRNRDGRLTHAELLDWLHSRSREFCGLEANRADCAAGLLPTLEIDRNLQVQPIATTLMKARPAELDVKTTSAELLNPASGALSGQLSLTWENGAVAGRFKLDEKMLIRIKSEVDGYLTLFDLNPGKQLMPLFPTSASEQAARIMGRKSPEDRRIGRGESLLIPTQLHGFELYAGEPLGKGQIVAVVTREPVDFSAVAGASRGAKIIATPVAAMDYLQTIAELLREPWTKGKTDQPVAWGSAVVNYEIVR